MKWIWKYSKDNAVSKRAISDF